jgi:DNA topoisomerase VI subunit B
MAAVLQRTTFVTSRLSEFANQRELVAQTGHSVRNWPLVILKECADNALDVCEEKQIAPVLEISVDTAAGEIVFTDNGPGIAPEIVVSILDYTTRTSSREAYITQSRGQQGNALKTVVAMPFTLDNARCGPVVIEAHGVAHQIQFGVNQITQEPQIAHETASSLVKSGTRLTVSWPATASDILEEAKGEFLQIAEDLLWLNPHLSLRATWDGDVAIGWTPTEPQWRKWRACDPSSPHWFDLARLERLAGAYVDDDRKHGRPDRSLRAFVAEFAGLTSTAKQKRLLEELGAARTSLASFCFRANQANHVATSRLLSAMCDYSEPVKPERLGVLGKDHILACFEAAGVEPRSLKYGRVSGMDDDLPFVIEAAFGWCPNATRRIVTGLNFSASIGNPFRTIGDYRYGDSLESLLAEQRAGRWEEIVFLLHLACPTIGYTDRGKTAATLPSGSDQKITELVRQVTAAWAKQRKSEERSAAKQRDAEERSAAVEQKRRDRLLRELRPEAEKKEQPEPTGVLAEKICSAAAEHAVPIDALAVPSPGNDPCMAWRRRREAEWFAQLFDRFVPAGSTKHLRGFFYLLVSSAAITGPDGKPFVNDYKHWQALQSASMAARWLGLIPFSRIVDERNAPAQVYVPGVTPISTGVSPGTGCEIPPTVEAALPRAWLAMRGRQTHRLIFYGEKSSLAIVLRPIAESVGAEMILTTGESSATYIADMAQRANEDGRPAVVFYFADFDPSGHQMPVSVSRKLQALRDLYYPDLRIKLYPVALSLDQIHALELPSSPLKDTESRARRWRERYGHDQTEIDAMVELHPEVLHKAVFEAIRPFYDRRLAARVDAAEMEWQEGADRRVKAHPEYKEATHRIRAAWKAVKAGVRNLHSEQYRAANLLESCLPPAPELPAAKPDSEATPPQFDSEADFVTATRRLINHKRLDDDH